MLSPWSWASIQFSKQKYHQFAKRILSAQRWRKSAQDYEHAFFTTACTIFALEIRLKMICNRWKGSNRIVSMITRELYLRGNIFTARCFERKYLLMQINNNSLLIERGCLNTRYLELWWMGAGGLQVAWIVRLPCFASCWYHESEKNTSHNSDTWAWLKSRFVVSCNSSGLDSHIPVLTAL